MVRVEVRMKESDDDGEWDAGLCGCFGHMGLCLYGFLCPCCLFGKNAQIMGENCFFSGLLYTLWPIFGVATSTALRGKIRNKKHISGSLVRDVIYTAFCPFCTLVQEARELSGAPDGAATMARA